MLAKQYFKSNTFRIQLRQFLWFFLMKITVVGTILAEFLVGMATFELYRTSPIVLSLLLCVIIICTVTTCMRASQLIWSWLFKLIPIQPRIATIEE